MTGFSFNEIAFKPDLVAMVVFRVSRRHYICLQSNINFGLKLLLHSVLW